MSNRLAILGLLIAAIASGQYTPSGGERAVAAAAVLDAKAKPAPATVITDSHRLRVREIEAEFATSQLVVMRELEKQKELQAEYNKAITEMAATCKDANWDGRRLLCVPKQPAKIVEGKKT